MAANDTVPKMHPDMQALIDARRPAPPNQTVAQQRENWNAYSGRLNRPAPDTLEITDRTVPGKGHDVPVRIYRPRAAQGLTGCMIYVHGGGFILGDLDSSDSIAWGFAEKTGATVISVDYRLAPEHPWPAGFDDCYAVLEWAAAQGAGIGIDPERITMGGDSAGARFSACVSLMARDRGGPRLRAVAMMYGNGGGIDGAKSMELFAEGYGLTAAGVKKFAEHLFTDGPDLSDPYCFPIHAEDLSNLPPTLVHTAELDPIRDAGRAYAAKLILAGNDVTYREARGMIHGFMRARFTGAQAAAEYQMICDFLAGHMA
ncbi:alpha/beta hydrolase fold domain-containing protein [Pseudooceanicola sp. 216_PA32_1]|uniref:Alpha/beta hydrolase fold domain-containing protein n=1 Tax=Pseudooceanicola pacificus TaxID=2676438 RepID=A0A844WEV5_9RHOB|nr:alpha/beta hydrolase [Pseudooceanicola pacificus]MWB78670.1 alpha/beta hydrolase fold domain-containing protein [Pseudooceanicola pacificus]